MAPVVVTLAFAAALFSVDALAEPRNGKGNSGTAGSTMKAIHSAYISEMGQILNTNGAGE